MLQTVPRRGFRFVVPVITSGEKTPTSSPRRSDTQVIQVATSRDGTRIAYATTGQGPPLLRAGHWLTHLELDWTSPIWRPMLDRLGHSFSLTRYDQRCTGLSGIGDDLSLDAFVNDLEVVADAGCLDRFPIFAASQGVPVAIAFAARHPERVTGLVLYGGYAQGRTVRGNEAEKQNAEAALTLIRQGWGRSGSAFAAAFATIYLPDASKEELQSMVEMQLVSAAPENVVALRVAIDAYDVTPLLSAVRAPTLVLHAREDSVQPLAQARLVAAGIKGAQLHVLESRNHVPLPRDPAWTEIMQAVEGFLG
jgi:pimeloyl-ACP methyl ester carboxylesterase